MKDKSEISTRERKIMSRNKKNDSTGKYSSRHIRNYEELILWKKKNNQKCGSKSTHYT